ncbi:MAG: hypothetical protein R8M45_04815 [Ghiorsea sp.]
MLKINQRQLIFASLAAISIGLSGCGGSDSTNSNTTPATNNTPGATAPSTISLTGVVVDGHIKGAIAFVDRDNDGAHDADEPSGVTDADGRYTLNDLQEGDEHFSIVVSIPVGATDSDTNTPIDKAYIMTTPAPGKLDGDIVVSPITTMIKTMMDNTPGADKYSAANAVRTKLGVSNANLDMFSDYVVGKTAGTDSADFKKLHKIAQVVARAVASQMVDVEAAAKQADVNVTLADVIALITNQVVNQLTAIESEVAKATTWDANTSGDAIVTNATIPVDTYSANFNAAVTNQITLTLAATEKAKVEVQRALAAAKVSQALTDMYAQQAASDAAAAGQAKTDAQAILAQAQQLFATMQAAKAAQDSYALAAQKTQAAAALTVQTDIYTNTQEQSAKVQQALAFDPYAYTPEQKAAITQAAQTTVGQQKDAYAAAQFVQAAQTLPTNSTSLWSSFLWSTGNWQ